MARRKSPVESRAESSGVPVRPKDPARTKNVDRVDSSMPGHDYHIGIKHTIEDLRVAVRSLETLLEEIVNGPSETVVSSAEDAKDVELKKAEYISLSDFLETGSDAVSGLVLRLIDVERNLRNRLFGEA